MDVQSPICLYSICQDKLKALKSAQQIHKGWVEEAEKIVQTGRQEVDLTEQISEEEYQKAKQEATRRVPLPTSDKTDEDIFKRLEQLEMQEEQNNELDLSYSSISESEESMDEEDDSQELTMQTDQENVLSFRREKLQRRVSWADQRSDSRMDEDSSNEATKYKCLPEPDPVPEEGESQQTSPTEDQPCEASGPVTPTDLYRIYRSNSLSKGSQSKSILKKTLSNPTVQEAGQQDFESWFQALSSTDEAADAPMPKVPLSESAKERKAVKAALDEASVAENPEPTERKQSRFKASRAKK